MKNLLLKSNEDLLREINLLRKLTISQNIPEELHQLYQWIEKYLNGVEAEVKKNLYFLSLDDPELYPEILNWTQNFTLGLRSCNINFIPTICRYNKLDNVCLKVLRWLHLQHIQTREKAFAISNAGDFAILPSKDFPIIYRIPVSSQNCLLNIPLFFHEFGHLLYLIHKSEMDDLVKSFQVKLEQFLLFPFQQNDEKHKIEREKAVIIIEIWYKWLQEFFCDAVGLNIGGASYLFAFSNYLRMMGNESFYLDENNLGISSHPVTWLRIKLLVERAKSLGLTDEANQIEEDWNLISKTLKINEDYHGFFTEEYFEDLKETINNMITEANPISFTDYNIKNFDENNIINNNILQILNYSTFKHQENGFNYEIWEEKIINTISN